MTQIETLQRALVDRYTIEKEIGVGGMATVYLARDLKHGRPVALKVLKPELGAVLGADRFLSEIKVTANLQHPNLLPLFDSGEAEGLLFYVMPFVTGESLRARLDREKQLPIEEAVRIAVACASALAYAHEHGVIHRDLKPENILLQSGQPVIADFGIALAVTNAGGTRVTQTGLSLGTPQYMSPEQATGDREIDARSDIYSLGAVTYEMIAGEAPHIGNSAQAIIAKLMTSEPRPLHLMRGTVPVHVAAAVEKALAKLPAHRFASATDFAAALQNPHFTLSTRSGIAAQIASGSTAAKRWKRIAIGAVTAALLVLAVGIWAYVRPTPPKQVLRYAVQLDSSEAIAGSLGRLALAPDGSKYVYSVLPGPKLVLRQRDQLHSTLIAGTDQAYSPFISADGTRVGYVGPPSSLHVISLNGGPPVLISDSASAPGGCFGPDGSIYGTAFNGRGIARFSESPGAPPKRITKVDSAAGEATHVWPDVLPDGKKLLFTISYGGVVVRGKSSAIAVADIATGKYHVLVSGERAHFVPPAQLLYVTTDGTLMRVAFDAAAGKLAGDPVAIVQGIRVGPLGAADFQVSRSGTLAFVTGGPGTERELVWIGRDGKAEQVDPTWKETFSSPAIAPDGKRVAVAINAKTGTNPDIWVKQLDRGPSLKLTFEGTTNIYPTWTPDGLNITYESNSVGTDAIFTKRADGSAQALLQFKWPWNLAEPLWSHDGKWLIIRTNTTAPGNGDILAMRPGIDTAAQSLVATKFRELTPTLSPDGKWMAYASDETGRLEIYVVPFPNVASAKWPISTQGGSEPLWSHSGKELFYRDGAGNLVSVAVTTAPTFSAGATTTLFPARDFLNSPNRHQYDVSPDDKRFLFIRAVGAVTSDKLVFVENWLEELNGKERK